MLCARLEPGSGSGIGNKAIIISGFLDNRRLLPPFTKGWLQCSLRNGISRTVPPSDGCDAGYLFPFSDPLLCALEEQGHPHTNSSLS